jgi:hypothetical protein
MKIRNPGVRIRHSSTRRGFERPKRRFPHRNATAISCGAFLLTLHLTRATIPHLAASGRTLILEGFIGGHWGKQHAISAGLDCAVHQSGLCRERSLAARTPFGSQCRSGNLSFLRERFAGRAAADRPAAAYEAARACGTPAAAAKAALANRALSTVSGAPSGPRERLGRGTALR